MRRVLLPLLLILVGLGLVVSIFQGPIAMRVLRTALERNMTSDPMAALPDGLHVVVCGAGGPLPDPSRSAPCLAVIAGQKLYLVDAGSAAARNLQRQGLLPSQVEAVFLTHFHSDHIDGLGELSVLRWAGGSKTMPLPLYGAEGVEQVSAGLNQAYRLDAAYRTAHHGSTVTPPTGAGLAARPFLEPPDGQLVTVFEGSGLRVSAFRVDHDPVKPAVGYRFEYAGRSVVVSGDTSQSPNLEKFAKDVDLLVHEALSPELMGVIQSTAEDVGNAGMAKISADVLTYHATPVEVARTAEAVGARHLLFHHIVPPMPLPGLASVFLEGVDEAYGGPVTLGSDGTMISLPSGSEAVRVVSE